MSHAESTHADTVAFRLVRLLREPAMETRVTDVRIGLGYTSVRLSDSRVGLAYTFREKTDDCCTVFKGMRPLSGRLAGDLLPMLTSTDLIEAAVGLACANALVNQPTDSLEDGDILDILQLGPSDDVAMVGHFQPLVEPIRARARSLTVFERIPKVSADLRPAAEAKDWLPRCSVALITSTSIINQTVDGLLQASHGCREVVMLGPSTPLLPDAFAPANVTKLCGVLVREVEEVLRVISEGGGMRVFKPYLRKVVLRIEG